MENREKSYRKKTVLVTGANSGIGKAASLLFAKRGHRVIMVCRDKARGEKARVEIMRATGSDQVALALSDVSSKTSIDRFCEDFFKTHDVLDVLIHNAAYVNHGAPLRLSDDGTEITFATNVAGPVYMTRKLAERLSRSVDARVLHAGSNIIKHFFDDKLVINPQTIGGEGMDAKRYRVYDRYRDSKMALLMLTFELAKELSGENIAVNMLQINGATMSPETLAKVTWPYRLVGRVQNLFFRSPEFMAGLYYEISVSERFRGVTGRLFNHRLEEMRPGRENPGLLEQIGQLAGASRYPRHALDGEVTAAILQRCSDWASMDR